MLDNSLLKRAAGSTILCLGSCIIGNWGVLALLQVKKQPEMEHNMPMPDSHYMGMISTIVLAMFVGLLICTFLVAVFLKYQTQQTWKDAIKLSLNMSFISMVLMMITEYVVRFILQPGADIMSIIHSLDYFKDNKAALISITALSASYLAALFYNYYRLKKYGKSCH